MNDSQHRACSSEILADYLHRNNMRLTAERFVILESVEETTAHFSVEDLCERIDAKGFRVSRATVYNTLDLLVQCSLARRQRFDGQKTLYEKVLSNPGHFHLVCTNCGRVREVRDNFVGGLLAERRFNGFAPSHFQLNIYGLCGRCARRSRRNKE